MSSAAVLLVAFTALVAAQTLPVVPDAYSSVVSMNFDRGFTLSFTEYWDGANERLRADGRFTPTDVSELIDFRAQVVYQWKPNDPTAACTAVNISIAADIIDAQMRPLMVPSRYYMTPPVAPVYVGKSTVARTINCDLWQTTDSTNEENRKMERNELYYWTEASSGAVTPVRLEFAQTITERANSSAPWVETSVHNYYDWVFFQPEAPAASWFTLPAQCNGVRIAQNRAQAAAYGIAAGSVFNITLPSASKVAPIPNPAPTFAPALPEYFRLVLEAKLTTSSQTVTAMKWFVSGENYERVDYLDVNHKLVSLIYDYTRSPAVVYNNSVSGCVTAELSTDNASPLYARAGSLPKLFSAQGNPLLFGQPSYLGRTLTRGVTADHFMQRERSLQNPYQPQNQYSFDMSVLFFPQGWVFPGREGVSSRLQLPVRVANNGTMSTFNAAGTAVVSVTQYSDVWDFFQLIPTEPDRKMTYDAVYLFGCPIDPPKPPETYGTSNAGTIAGVLIGCLLAVGLAYGAYRWWKTHRQAKFHGDIQGMTKADDTTTAGAAQA